MKLYAMRSKKTGRYFRFEQHTEDGWGKHEDSVFVNKDGHFYPDHLPTFFPDNPLQRPHYDFKDHKDQEVELVEFELKGGGL